MHHCSNRMVYTFFYHIDYVAKINKRKVVNEVNLIAKSQLEPKYKI
jgi:hypothetical protein